MVAIFRFLAWFLFVFFLPLLVLLLASSPSHAGIIKVQPYVEVTVSPASLDLGTVPAIGPYDSPATLTVHVAANCNHGPVVASMMPLTAPGGVSLPLERVFVKRPVTNDYVAMIAPVVLSAPHVPGQYDLKLYFRVETTFGDPPGQYSGTLVLTCAPLP